MNIIFLKINIFFYFSLASMGKPTKKRGKKKGKVGPKRCLYNKKKISKTHLPLTKMKSFAACERRRKMALCKKENRNKPLEMMDWDCRVSGADSKDLPVLLRQRSPQSVSFKTAYYILHNVLPSLVPPEFRAYWKQVFDSWNITIMTKPRKEWSSLDRSYDRFLKGGRTALRPKKPTEFIFGGAPVFSHNVQNQYEGMPGLIPTAPYDPLREYGGALPLKPAFEKPAPALPPRDYLAPALPPHNFI